MPSTLSDNERVKLEIKKMNNNSEKLKNMFLNDQWIIVEIFKMRF